MSLNQLQIGKVSVNCKSLQINDKIVETTLSSYTPEFLLPPYLVILEERPVKYIRRGNLMEVYIDQFMNLTNPTSNILGLEFTIPPGVDPNQVIVPSFAGYIASLGVGVNNAGSLYNVDHDGTYFNVNFSKNDGTPFVSGEILLSLHLVFNIA